MEKSKVDKQSLLDRLLDAVKQCQVRFGGRTELATDVDSRVSCLCAQFETVLMHCLKKPTGNPLTAIKQKTGIQVPSIPGIKNDADSGFWPIVKEHLTRHELQRYTSLKNITTDAGRGRAWLRSTLNEHSLERYLHMIQGNKKLLVQFYEPLAFLLDEERASMLPTMARGLGSILFAINIDNKELNGIKPVSMPSLAAIISTEHSQPIDYMAGEQEPVLSKEVSSRTGSLHEKERKEKKKKKKKKGPTSIVSFDDNDSEEKSSTESYPALKRKSKGQKSSPSKSGSSQISDTSTVQNINEYKVLDHQISQDKGHRLQFTEQLSNTSGSTEGGTVDKGTSNKQLEDVTPTNSIPIDFRISAQSAQGWSEKTESSLTSQSHLSSSYPGKTPPSTPYNSSLLSQYEELGEKIDADYINKKLQDRESQQFQEPSSLPNSDELEGSGETDSTTDKKDLLNGEVHLRVGNGNQDDERRCSSGLFQVLGDEGPGDLIPLSQDAATEDTQSNDSSMLGFGVETESATIGVALAQKGLQLRLPKFLESASLPSPEYESLSHDDLKQALMSIMMRKDEVEDQNKSLRMLLDSEMEHTAKLRAELEELKKDYDDQEEKSYAKVQNLTRENELLKHQLKKYVGAVQMLRREGPSSIEGIKGIRKDDLQPPIPEPKPPLVDYSEQSAEYERKLIQVAEMHGELMEFNDHLTRVLKSKEHSIQRLKAELVDLRGPLPDESSISEDASSQDIDSASLTSPGRPLINLWIPSAFIKGKSKDTFHVYQVYIRIRDEEWNVYKRYTQFRDFHNILRKSHPAINKFEFPPKKAVGNKEAKFVETRRKLLQDYLRHVINYHMHNNADLTNEPSKATLVKFMPFFGDVPVSKSKKQERPRSSLLSGRTNAGTTENTYEGF
ncbi:sorting nexin-29-like [Anneissia japonica]|uniref:sorting nexin-29-like n=1 Tax=Anneissia japonica TaxID=1529436 RepID=UPI00142550AD|nr:sorting nexin-29-like [Anneissia japonica]XP_033116983.1 sorting nexin-29-like [Anneissia japonica]XP_033116990.1 sorting nexin-29-like [Anneissia japonica]XP_033116998.1 sorting nexin-29-like [Anneissia japonica]